MLNQELKLDPKERETYDNLADLYSIFVATEALEKSYIRDVISAEDYTSSCLKLIAQYKTITNLMSIPIQDFIKEYKLNTPAAHKRLVEIGVPATIEHSIESNKPSSKYIAETVQLFITLMDSLKLNLYAVDQLHPQLSDLIQSINRLVLGEYEKSKNKLKDWLITLNKMKASDELNPEQARQFLFDLESAYADLQHALD